MIVKWDWPLILRLDRADLPFIRPDDDGESEPIRRPAPERPRADGETQARPFSDPETKGVARKRSNKRL